MPPELNLEQLQDDLLKGNLVGDEAEAAAKAIQEAEDAKKDSEDDDLSEEEIAAKAAQEAKDKEDEEQAAYDKLSDEEKAQADAKAAEEAEEAEREERNKRIKVPKFRLDAATARARKAEKEADELRKQLAEKEAAKDTKDDKAEKTPDELHEERLADIDSRIAEAMKDGDTTEIAKLMKESRAAEREFMKNQNDAKISESSNMTAAQVKETNLLNSILDQLEEQFPMFDENSDDFNDEANADVLKVQKGLIAMGESASDALIEAVNLVLPKYGYSTEEEDKGGKADKGDKDGKGGKEDKQKGVKRNLDAAKRTPPDMDDAGEDSDSAGAESDLPNILDLTDAEYDALPEATKKAMRGDVY